MKLVILAVLLSVVAPAWAQPLDVSGVAVTGEASFDYNNLASGSNPYPGNGAAPSDQYRLNQAQLLFRKETEEISFWGRLNYTPIAVTTPNGANKSSAGTLDQMEVYYKLTPEVLVGFGRFGSTLGFESIMRSENVFYTNSVAYQALVPGYNEGLRLRYNPGDWLSATVSTYNQSTNNMYGDDYTPTKTTELSLTGAVGDLTWFAGHYFGADRSATDPTKVDNKKISDVWLTYKFTPELVLSLIYDDRTIEVQDGPLRFTQANTAQLSYVLGKHTLGLRYESILGASDLDSLNGSTNTYYPAGASRVNVLSVGDKFNVSSKLNLYLEYRRDTANNEVLVDRNNNPQRNLDMLTLGIVAFFN